MTYRRKLIEVALPLDKINAESAREKSIRHGHPSTLHIWWARRPLAACRAVIFSSLVDDPGEPDAPKELLEAIDKLAAPRVLPAEWDSMSQADQRRERLFEFIGELVKWENTTNEIVIGKARELIQLATGGNPPPLLDPFCGGGSIPLEGQRLGLEVYASDLNPVAVLITKALVEIPPKFAGRPPVNPDDRGKGHGAAWKGAAGLAADVRWYGKWMRDRAWERISHLYPKGPNGETVIAWLWARTVRCPNPACSAEMPLVRSFQLSTKTGGTAWVEAAASQDGQRWRFEVRSGGQPELRSTVDRRGALCLHCSQPVALDYIRAEGAAGRMGIKLMAIVTASTKGRVYISPTSEHEKAAIVDPGWRPDTLLPDRALGFRVQRYGMVKHADLFTPRQLAMLSTLAELAGEAREQALAHAQDAFTEEGGKGIADGGSGAHAYADAVATYLGLAISKLADSQCALARWKPSMDQAIAAFARQAMAMVWDFAESNAFNQAAGDYGTTVETICKVLLKLPASGNQSGIIRQLDAAEDVGGAADFIAATDPPYYDNIGYADLSDFFYIWLRKALSQVYPTLFATVLTPKAEELIASPFRFQDAASKRGEDAKAAAKRHFEVGLSKSFSLLHQRMALDFPFTLYYAFKQTEVPEDARGRAGIAVSTGWETMLHGLLANSLQVVGTWPVRTEMSTRNVARSTNALASAVVLVCRKRPDAAPLGNRREFQQMLRDELPKALVNLTGGHIAPVDLAQSAIGPGMAVFSRYAKVIEADGSEMSVRAALGLINEAIEDYFAEQEGAYDPDTQFCVRWFEQHGFTDGSYGDADNMARAKNIGVEAMARNGVLESKAGKVRLLPLSDYERDADTYDPAADRRPTVWEACHYLAAALQSGGERSAARLVRRLGGLADQARDLAYRLYDVCDRKGWAEPARGYNALVASWPAIQNQAAQLDEEQQQDLL